MGLLQNIISSTIDIILPQECIGCGRWNTWLCDVCKRSIPLYIDDLCIVCNKPAVYGLVHAGCIHKTPLTGVVASAEDTATLRNVVHCLKYEQVRCFSFFCSELIENRISVHPYLSSLMMHTDTVVIPVPLHTERLWERGFNQSEMIARHVFGDLVRSDVMIKNKKTAQQADLDKKHRATNLHGVFEIIKPEVISGKSVIIVDDIITTGATVTELARVLYNAGAKDLWAVSVTHVV